MSSSFPVFRPLLLFFLLDFWQFVICLVHNIIWIEYLPNENGCSIISFLFFFFSVLLVIEHPFCYFGRMCVFILVKLYSFYKSIGHLYIFIMILMLILIHLVIIRLDIPSILTLTRIQLFLFLTVILCEDLTFSLVIY